MAESSEGTVPAWILAACSGDDYRDMNHPHSVLFRGETWTAGTNGHVMALARVDLGLPPSAALKWDKVLEPPEVPPQALDTAALREWAGCAPVGTECPVCGGKRKAKCRSCDGTGRAEHECYCGDRHDAECEGCNGEKVVSCKRCAPGQYDAKETAMVFRGTFNRCLFRRVLQDFPVTDERYARATWRQSAPRAVGWIEAMDGSWVIGVMPMNPDSVDKFDGPAFPSPEVTA